MVNLLHDNKRPYSQRMPLLSVPSGEQREQALPRGLGYISWWRLYFEFSFQETLSYVVQRSESPQSLHLGTLNGLGVECAGFPRPYLFGSALAEPCDELANSYLN